MMEFDFLGRAKKPRGVHAQSGEPAEIRRAKLSLLRRAKNAEREFARWLILHDGKDPRFYGLTTSTGRIGHVTGIQADALSLSYLAEVKNAVLPSTVAKQWQSTIDKGDAVGTDEALPVAVARFWQKINVKGLEWAKEPVLFWKPSNAGDFPVNGKPLPDLHVIREERHADLLAKEQFADLHGFHQR